MLIFAEAEVNESSSPFSRHCSITALKSCSGTPCSCCRSLSPRSVRAGSCVFTVVSDISEGEAANLNSHRFLNYVPEFCTASREQLSLWHVAPVQRKCLHFCTPKPLKSSADVSVGPSANVSF